MKKIIIPFLFIAAFYNSNAQVGIGTTSPQANLDVREPNPSSPNAFAGIAIPQVSSLPTTGNRAGQILFHTTNKIYYYWDGSAWLSLGQQSSSSIGDIKYGFQTADHGGWILLNGRAKTSLTTNQQAAATAMGIGANLPNMADKFIKGNSGAEVLGSPAGSNTATVPITKANLPAYDMTATTDAKGSHNHSGSTTDVSGTHQHTATTNPSTAHTHDVSYNNTTNKFLLTIDLGLGKSVVVPPGASTATSTTTPEGVHTHTLTTTINEGSHQHNLSINAALDHTHNVTVNTGGGGTALSVPIVPSSIVANTFIYLGN